MTTLTPRQLATLVYIRDQIQATGCAPTHGMICTAMGFRSKAQAARMIDALETKGFLRRIPHGRRGIEIVKPVPETAEADLAAAGWRRVREDEVVAPREATMEMIIAALDRGSSMHAGIYSAMINARPRKEAA